MIAIQVPEAVEAQLEELSRTTGISKDEHVRLALEAHFDEIEDTDKALYRLAHPGRRWSLEEVERGDDLV